MEYWVYKSEDGNSFDPFHFDKDERDPQITHPKWSACINMTLDKGATCISNMTYGDIKPTECVYSYGAEGKTVMWDGNVAWSDMAGHDDCKLYVNVWTDRENQRIDSIKRDGILSRQHDQRLCMISVLLYHSRERTTLHTLICVVICLIILFLRNPQREILERHIV